MSETIEGQSVLHVIDSPSMGDPKKVAETVQSGNKKNLCYVVPNCSLSHNHMESEDHDCVSVPGDKSPNVLDLVKTIVHDHQHSGYVNAGVKKHDDVTKVPQVTSLSQEDFDEDSGTNSVDVKADVTKQTVDVHSEKEDHDQVT